MKYKKGDCVRIARDLYPDDHAPSCFVGRVGRVTGVRDGFVTVNGLGDLGEPFDPKSWGFDIREVEPA
jgi:ribosomal protein L21E